MTIGIPTANGIQFPDTAQRVMEMISMKLIIIPMPSMNRWTVLNFFVLFAYVLCLEQIEKKSCEIDGYFAVPILLFEFDFASRLYPISAVLIAH